MCEIQNSILASIGKFIQPIFTPLGFGSQIGAFGWVFAVAGILGLIAKENVIAGFLTLSSMVVTLFGNPETAMQLANAGVLSPEVVAMLTELIASGEAATDVCYKCGFRDYSTFSRAYRKMFDESPAGRRKKDDQ